MVQSAHFKRRLYSKLALIKALIYDRVLGVSTAQEGCQQHPSPYGRLEKMIKYLRLSPDDVFLDLGCARGRVVFFVGLQKIKKVIGIELDKKVYEIAKKNLDSFRFNKNQIEILNISVVDFDPKEVTVFYMFSPFNDYILERVLNNIKQSLDRRAGKIRIVYYAPEYAFLLDQKKWLIREGEIGNSDCLVWRSR
jgi:SAM-dependent methyltransferase